jgi:hypothetical protein
MKISRRAALKSVAAVSMFRLKAEATATQGFRLQPDDPTLTALAETVLPSESDRGAALAAFVAWHDNYTEGADADHGYGVTRVRATGPAPGKNYPAQLAALDAAARAAGASSFAAAALAKRRTIVEAAIADAKIERLPARPTGGHIASDLMGHYFNSSVANDLCYRAAINRDACRGLAGSENPPKEVIPPKGGNYGVGQ